APHYKRRRPLYLRGFVYIALIKQKHLAKPGLANIRRVLQDGIKYWSQFARRGADDFEHVSGGDLLLERCPQLVEQPRILNCNNGLGGEILHQIDLLVAEGTDFLAITRD